MASAPAAAVATDRAAPAPTAATDAPVVLDPVVTTMRAPAWVDWLVLRRPLRRVLRWAIVRPCAPKANVRWCALYRAEAVEPGRVARFETRLAKEIKVMARRLT